MGHKEQHQSMGAPERPQLPAKAQAGDPFHPWAVRHLLTPERGEDKQMRLPTGGVLAQKMIALQEGFVPPIDAGHWIETGRPLLFWSDQHFYHANIQRHTAPARDRFADSDDMSTQMMLAARAQALHWAEQTGEEPWIVFAGDIGLGSVDKVNVLLESIPAKKWLVVGNHDFDRKGNALNWAVDAISFSMEFSVSSHKLQERLLAGPRAAEWEASPIHWDSLPNAVRFGVCHYPVRLDFVPLDVLHLHGHIHDLEAPPARLNLSVERLDFQPQSMETLLEPKALLEWVQRLKKPQAMRELDAAYKARQWALRAEKDQRQAAAVSSRPR